MDPKIELYTVEYEVFEYNELGYTKHYYIKRFDLTLNQATKLKNILVDDRETHYEFVNIIKQ